MNLPQTTMAVRITEHGGSEVLTWDEFPLSPLGATDVLVSVHTASVSRWDVKYRNGQAAGLKLPGRSMFPLPQQLGREASGKVVAVGPAVTTLRPGDHVVAATHPEDPYSTESARGLGNLSKGVEIPGHQSLGSCAQFLVRDQHLWFRLDPDVDLEQAAVTLWPFSTSHRVLSDRLHTQIGQTVLVLGAAGGMGQASVQLAHLMGLTVVAMTRNPAKTELLRAGGADVVLSADDPVEAAGVVKDLTSGNGLDHVIDYVGEPSLLENALSMLRVGGSVCLSGGEHHQGYLPVTAADMVRLELNLLGIRGARRHDAMVTLGLLSRRAISTRIASRYAMSDVARAHDELEGSRDLVGRIVLDPWG